MNGMALSLLAAATLAASLAGTGAVLRLLSRHAILDHPNARSSHYAPIPRGGGLAVAPVLMAAWLAAVPLGADATASVAAVVGAAALAMLSWVDDLADLSPLVRLLGHALAVTTVLTVAPGPFNLLSGTVPWPGDVILAGLAWLWFVNLFNFMDGIDGITAAQTVAIGAGVAVIAAYVGNDGGLTALGLTAAAAALGFLWWNRPPARIFLGDVGSVPLGFLLGGLLLHLATRGAWAAALILPLYYLADASLTIAGRVLRRERFWQAHRQHAYQRAVDGGRSHGAVVGGITVANIALILLALVSAAEPAWSLAALMAAVAIVACLLVWMRRGAVRR